MINPDLRILFTVSPIRHLKDGAHGNQISRRPWYLLFSNWWNGIRNLRKTTFRLMKSYWMSWEIIGFTPKDMVHPSNQAINIYGISLYPVFAMTSKHKIMHQWEEIQKAMNHKPSTGSGAYQNLSSNYVKNRTNYKENTVLWYTKQLKSVASPKNWNEYGILN